MIINGTINIHRPPEVVFDTVADETNEPLFNPRLRRVVQTTPGPLGVGTRFHAETSSLGRNATMTIEFTEFERPRRLASTTHMWAMEFAGVLTFEPIPDGTRMSWSWDMRPHGLLTLLTLLGPVVTAIGRHQEQSIWRGLKQYLEEGRTPVR